MSRRIFGLLVLVLGLSRPVLAQEPPKPTDEHKQLAELVGTWNATITMPDGSPPSKGVANYKLDCGGLWLTSDFEGDFGPMKFQGKGFDGYDVLKKKYVSVWVDSFSTSPLLLEGELDKTSNLIVMSGTGPGPDGKPAKYKTTSTSGNKDKHIFKMFLVVDGKDNLMMTIEYTRKK